MRKLKRRENIKFLSRGCSNVWMILNIKGAVGVELQWYTDHELLNSECDLTQCCSPLKTKKRISKSNVD